MKLFIAFFLSIAAYAANSYSTTFPATENPISEGGNWINGGVTAGGSFHNVRSTTSAAFGTQPGGQGNCTGSGDPSCGDSTAVITGSWGATQTAQAVVYVIGTPADFSEVEIRLRTTITSGSITGYEFNCSVVPGDPYMQIVRWNGTIGNFTLLDARAVGCVNGDIIKATASGSTLTVFKNGTSVFSVTDATYTGGSPGIGMFATNTTGQANYGFSYFAATDSTAAIISDSCSSANVSTALAAAVSGSTVLIPPGTCNWSSQVAWTAPTNTTLKGAGSQSTVGGGDFTVIQDNYAGGNNPLLTITTNSSAAATFRLTGLTFRGGSAGTGNDKFDGIVSIQGSSANIRVDHTHLDVSTYSPAIGSSGLSFQGCTTGVVDHFLWDAPAGSVNNGVRVYNQGTCNSDALGVGDQSWTLPTGFGTVGFLFVEDSTFHSGAGNDCTKGGRYVWRNNTMVMTTPPPSVQTHPTGGGQRERGCRATEVYNNSATAVASNYINAFDWISSGTSLVWGNTLPSSATGGGTGFRTVISGHEMRRDNSTYTQSPTPTGWGYCGTSFNGTGSNWDQNTSASTGYACLDQIGRGAGQLLVLDFPNAKNNVTGTIAWPNQALEPVYEWADAYSPVPSNPSGIWAQTEPVIVQNQDYYLGTSNTGTPISFTGATGVGAGASASRTSTCTAGVAYWASDISHLLQCSATNTWSDYYTPFTYPHPLQGGAVSAAGVLTSNATSITGSTATAGGNVRADGGGAVSARGTCYSTSANPTSPCTSDGSGTGSFTSSLTGLSSGTLYHMRAKATNSNGTSYGADITFSTTGSVGGAASRGGPISVGGPVVQQ